MFTSDLTRRVLHCVLTETVNTLLVFHGLTRYIFSIPESVWMMKVWASQGVNAVYVAIGAAKSHGHVAAVSSRENSDPDDVMLL